MKENKKLVVKLPDFHSYKYLDNLSSDEVIKLEIDTGRPICYELDDDLKPIKHYYIDETK